MSNDLKARHGKDRVPLGKLAAHTGVMPIAIGS